jgi:hypothetical protein
MFIEKVKTISRLLTTFGMFMPSVLITLFKQFLKMLRQKCNLDRVGSTLSPLKLLKAVQGASI